MYCELGMGEDGKQEDESGDLCRGREWGCGLCGGGKNVEEMTTLGNIRKTHN